MDYSQISESILVQVSSPSEFPYSDKNIHEARDISHKEAFVPCKCSGPVESGSDGHLCANLEEHYELVCDRLLPQFFHMLILCG